MPLINIPTRNSENLNAAADINDLMANTAYTDGRVDDLEASLNDQTHPIGSTYIQTPTIGNDGKSNTKTTAFPTAQEPGELFGGTWTQQFNDEGIFFKTEGDALSQTNGENNARSNGLQTDLIKNHAHPSGGPCSSGPAYVYNVSGAAWQYGYAPDTGNNYNGGLETRPRNRFVKVWKRTA